MKILHTVEFYYPSVGGAQEVVRQLSEHMAAGGHNVTVATTKLPGRTSLKHNGVKIAEFDISGNSVRGTKGEKKKYQEFLKNTRFDVVMNYAAQEWAADLFFEVMDDVKAAKVFVPCGYSALYDPDYKEYFEKLPDILRRYDATVYLSDDYRDINFARQHKIKKGVLIPNGADEAEFGKLLSSIRKAEIRKKYGIEGLMIMTIANYTGEKGHEELLYVFKRLPVRKATLVSAGSTTPHIGCYDMFESQADVINRGRRFPGKKIVMVDGSKRDEVRDLLKSADLFVFLSNIEASPLVLFEAAAAGVPFVASAAGNSAEIAKWTGGGVIVKSFDRPNGRVKVSSLDAFWKVNRLARNEDRRRQLGRAGREAWMKRFTWQKLSSDYLKLYERLLASKGVGQ